MSKNTALIMIFSRGGSTAAFWTRPPFGFLWMLGLVGVAVALGVFPIIRRLLKRLDVLQHSVQRFGEGDLSARVPVQGHDEVADLSRHFNAAAQRLLQHSTLPLCVVMGDIDHFKRVNDGYGHAVGDVALVHVARQIAAGLRANDVLARFGGEEFAAILPVHHLEQGQEVVDRIRAHIAQQPLVLADGRSLPLTLSFGLAMIEQVPLAASTDAQRILLLINEAIRLADDALYQAKASGRNCVRLAPGALNAQVFVREL